MKILSRIILNVLIKYKDLNNKYTKWLPTKLFFLKKPILKCWGKVLNNPLYMLD